MEDHATGYADDRADQDAYWWSQYETSPQAAKSRSERQAQNKTILHTFLPKRRADTRRKIQIADPTLESNFRVILGVPSGAERAALLVHFLPGRKVFLYPDPFTVQAGAITIIRRLLQE